MKLSATLANLFDEDERKHLQQCIAKDRIPVEYMLRVLKYRLTQTRADPKMLLDTNYPFKRAFYDGRASELEFFINLIEGNETNG